MLRANISGVSVNTTTSADRGTLTTRRSRLNRNTSGRAAGQQAPEGDPLGGPVEGLSRRVRMAAECGIGCPITFSGR